MIYALVWALASLAWLAWDLYTCDPEDDKAYLNG